MTTNSEPLLRWILRRGTSRLTCQVDTAGKTSRQYLVSVVPHWDVESSIVETVKGPRVALQRHAEIALRLREVGWSVVRDLEAR